MLKLNNIHTVSNSYFFLRFFGLFTCQKEKSTYVITLSLDDQRKFRLPAQSISAPTTRDNAKNRLTYTLRVAQNDPGVDEIVLAWPYFVDLINHVIDRSRKS